MKKLRLNRSTWLLIAACVFLVAAVVALGAVLVRQSNEAMTVLIRSRMLDISRTAASMLDGDALEKLTAESKDTPEYRAAMETLTHFQENIDLSYIYCIRDLGSKKFVFTVDPTVADPGEFGEPIVYTEALYQASLGESTVDLEPYEDKWGRFYSAYSPVFDSAGKVGGIVAVDFSASWFEDQAASQRRSIIVFSALTVAMGGLILFAVIHSLRKRMRVLYERLNGLADNVEDLVLEIEGQAATQSLERRRKAAEEEAFRKGDEINALGNKILSMEEALRGHISQIRAMAFIDAMTAVGNKAAYMDTVKRLEAAIAKGNAVFAICVFDMNGLKTINDNYGHECGDQALMDAANVLMKVFRKQDLYRVGGDEFTAIIRESSAKTIENLFKLLDYELAGFNKKERPYKLPLSVSKGYAIYTRDLDTAVRSVGKRADEMMYADKAAYYAEHGDRRRKTD